jgi:hypothetical protein
MQDITKELSEKRSRVCPFLAGHQRILEQPYVVQKEYTGVRLALLIGNMNAKLWYDCPHTADAEGV